MQCPICFSEEEEKINVEFPCKHKCCLNCFTSLKKYECMMCRKQLENLVPEVLKHNKDLTSVVVEHEYLSYLGARIRREMIRARIRRLRGDMELPLLLTYNDDSSDDSPGRE